MKKKFSVYDMTIIGLMAALCYVGTLIRIDIPTPLGKMMVHFGNVFCLLSGLLFGGMKGALSSSIGSGIFDLLNGWATSFPSTFINKFVMGFLAGKISNCKGKKLIFDILGAAAGIYGYIFLYLTYSFLKNIVLGSAVETAWTDVIFKAPISLANGTLALIVSVILASVLRPVLTKAGIYSNLSK